MGQFFERTLVQDKGISGLMTMIPGIKKAAAAVGYQPCEDGLGVPVRFTQYPDSEWFDFQSPLLESPDTAEPFLAALAKEGRVPVLSVICVDSDFVVCRLFDTKNETDTIACLGTPYEPLGEPDYAAWAAMCKKSWKCKPAQFQSIFEGEYTFAEDGLEPLAALLHFTPVILPEEDETRAYRTFWFLPDRELNETTRPHTLAEKLADYMEREYAGKLEAAGFRRYKNSPVRWHKVVGEPGNEVLLSMVFATYRGYELAPMYGAQSLFCPLVLSDKYYPMHDAEGYWKEAKFEYPRKFGKDPLVIRNNPEAGGWDTVLSFNDPKQLPPFIDDLILPELSEVRDLSSCHALYRNSLKEGDIPSLPCPFPSFAERVSRLWIEAALLGDEAETQRLCKEWKKQEKHWTAQEKELWPEAVRACETGGAQALVAYLRGTVYRDNLRKLKRAGIV